MRAIPINTILTRSEMERVALSCGQFAHLSEADVRSSLDDLYNLDVRNTDPTLYEEAVPQILAQAHEMGASQQIFVAFPTLDYLARDRYALCVLCGDTGKHFWWGDVRFMKHVCPSFTYFICEEGRELGWPACICDACGRPAKRKTKQRTDEDAENLWNECLARLVNEYPDFRERVRRNRHIWTTLRFDPRREEIA